METQLDISTIRDDRFSEQEKVRLRRAVKDFEAIFVSQMLKSMRSSLSTSGMFGDSFGGEVLEGIFDLELGRHLSAHSSFGLAELLYKQITGEDFPSEPRKITRPVTTPDRQRTHAPPTEQFPRPVVAGKTLYDRIQALEPYIHEASRKFGLDESLIKAVIAAESAARVDALSPKNAKGLMQLMDGTALEMGVQNVWDPRENILGGSRYLRKMLQRHQGDVVLALASYNAGPGAVDRFNGVPPFRETHTYIERVLRYQRIFNGKKEDANEIDRTAQRITSNGN